MNTVHLFESLEGESADLFSQLVDLNPIGNLLINESLEIVNINNTLKRYFDNDLELTKKYFGDIFRCGYLNSETEKCGYLVQCEHCEIRHGLLEALESNRPIKNLQINKPFFINGKRTMKWFDMTIVPIVFKKKHYLWISLIDLTELMKYKIQFEMNRAINEEELHMGKIEFHNKVMESISLTSKSNCKAYLILIELKQNRIVEEQLGTLWQNELLSNVQTYLKDLIGDEYLICRYSKNQIILYLPCQNMSSFDEITLELNQRMSDFFQYGQFLETRIAKIKYDAKRIVELVETDRLYMEYFKVISKFERLSAVELLEVTL